MECPSCGAENRPMMRICCECGEPLDASLPAVAHRDAPVARPSWELLLGLALLLGVAVVAVALGWQGAARSDQGRIYHQAQDDAAHGDLLAALTAFGRAGDYQDAPAQVRRLEPQVKALEAHYDAGVKAEASHAWWDAAYALRQAVDIQVSYRDVITRLAEARAENGPIFYRAPVPEGGTALWWAQADGGDQHRLPSGPASELAAISPDGHWAVYSFGSLGRAGADPEGPYLLDLKTGRVASLTQKYHEMTGGLRVRFRDDSKGFWWGFDNQAFYYDLAPPPGAPASLELPEMPGAADARHARLLLNRVLLSTNVIYSRLLLSDEWGRNRTEIAEETGEVLLPHFSEDGRYLLYLLDSNLTDTPDGHTVITTSLVLRDLAAPSSSSRQTLYSARTILDGKPVISLYADFEPGSDNLVLVDRADQNGAILRNSARAWGGALLHRWSPNGAPLSVLPQNFYSLYGQTWAALDPTAGSDAVSIASSVIAPIKTHDGGRALLLGDFTGPFGLYARRLDGSDPQLVVKAATAFWTDRTIPHPAHSLDGNATFLDR
ncbi:MAG: hypothetical protein ACR2M0_15930 [Chloroflexia bacterium]